MSEQNDLEDFIEFCDSEFGKEKGPRLAPFLLSLDRKFVEERFGGL